MTECLSVLEFGLANSSYRMQGNIRSCRADNLECDERRKNLPSYLPICPPKSGAECGLLCHQTQRMWGAPALLRSSLGYSFGRL